MDIEAYIKPLIKWWWLIVIAVILAVIASSIATLFQAPVYISRTTLMVGRAIMDPNPDTGQIFLAQGLASTYADIAKREPIQMATMEALGINWLPSYNARALPGTQLIEISVTDVDPQRAQIIASELANQLILFSPVNSDPIGADRQNFIDAQLVNLQNQIVKTQDELDQLSQKIGDLNSAREIANARSEISALEAKLLTLQSSYANLLSNTEEGASNIIQLFEPASLPTRPISTNRLYIIALAAMVGAVLASGAAYLIEYLNKTFDSTEDVEREVGYPVLGNIPKLNNPNFSWTYVDSNPISHFAESFRNLRTNIEVRTKNINKKSLLISSAIEGEGKSTVAINLALAYSYLGKSVIIVDTDLRRPKIHEVLDIELEPGLSEIILGDAKITDVIKHWKGYVFAIPSGKFSENENELLSSRNFLETMTVLKDIADVVILDGPPYFLSDSSVMSTIVDGVLIVVSLGGSEKGMIRKMRSQLEMVKASVIGVAVNKNEDFKVYGYYDQSKDSGKKDYLEFEKPKTLKDYFRKGNNNFKKSKNSQTQAESAGDEFGFPVDGSSSLGRKQVPRIENPESVLDQIMQSSNKSINYDDKISLKELAERNRSSEDHAKDSPSGNTSEQTLPQNPIRKNKAPIKQGNSQARKTSPSEPEEEIKPHVDGSADLNTFLDSIDPTKKNKKPGKGLFSR